MTLYFSAMTVSHSHAPCAAFVPPTRLLLPGRSAFAPGTSHLCVRSPVACSNATSRCRTNGYVPVVSQVSRAAGPPPSRAVVWERLGRCEVALPADVANRAGPVPPVPRAVIHFVGGFIAGARPRELYREIIEQLVQRGQLAVIATPLPADPSVTNHLTIARAASHESASAIATLVARWHVPWIPVFGLGHSLGAKVQILLNSDPESRANLGPRIANILLAYNNYALKQAVPQLEQLRAYFRDYSGTAAGSAAGSAARSAAGTTTPDTANGSAADAQSVGPKPGASASSPLADIMSRVSDVAAAASSAFAASDTMSTLLGSDAAGFISELGSAAQRVGDILSSEEDPVSPTPAETRYLVREQYAVDSNLVVSYTGDTIDCSSELIPVLRDRFGPSGAISRILPGTHVTPMTPALDNTEAAASARRSSGFDRVDERLDAIELKLRAASSRAVQELDDTVTVILAFVQLHLERLEEQRAIRGS